MITYDNGLGPYDYCKRGLSHCDDQTCGCVDTAGYRMMYQRARERRGWNGYTHNPMRALRTLALITIACMTTGLLIVALLAMIGALR